MNCEICKLKPCIGQIVNLIVADGSHATCEYCGSNVEPPSYSIDATYVGNIQHQSGTEHRFRVQGLLYCPGCNTKGTHWGVPCGNGFTWPGLFVENKIEAEQKI